jgi:hypothetical protein
MMNAFESERFLEELEARQRSILWPDYLRANRNVFEFLWKGDPNAKPVQRAGLFIFAMHFWLMGVYFAAGIWASGAWGGRVVGSVIGLVLVPISIRLFLNAFLRQTIAHKAEQDSRE